MGWVVWLYVVAVLSAQHYRIYAHRIVRCGDWGGDILGRLLGVRRLGGDWVFGIGIIANRHELNGGGVATQRRTA